MFNEGDTTILMLNYTLNGEALTENSYQEMELQINPQGSFNAVKKLLSDGGIAWDSVSYEENGTTKTFTGYVVYLTQEETFKIRKGTATFQLRIMQNDEVGSSDITSMNVGDALSTKVLHESED